MEYTKQILDGNDIEPPISENHNHMQIILICILMQTIKV